MLESLNHENKYSEFRRGKDHVDVHTEFWFFFSNTCHHEMRENQLGNSVRSYVDLEFGERIIH